MKIKEWFKKNMNFKRDETEVRENKEYCGTLAIAGFIAGGITGIMAVVLQFVISSHDAQQTWINIVSSVVMIAMVAYLVYLLLPMFKDANRSIGTKAVTALLAIVCMVGAYAIAMALVVLAAILIVLIAGAWIALKIWGTSGINSPLKSAPPQSSNSGSNQYKLSDGTIITDHGLGSYTGSDFHDYERNLDGTFSRID